MLPGITADITPITPLSLRLDTRSTHPVAHTSDGPTATPIERYVSMTMTGLVTATLISMAIMIGIMVVTTLLIGDGAKRDR